MGLDNRSFVLLARQTKGKSMHHVYFGVKEKYFHIVYKINHYEI